MLRDVQAVLVIGTKLQHVVATMALEKRGVHGPYIGVLLKPRDQLFWFNQPKWLLYLLHLILFEVCTLFTNIYIILPLPVVGMTAANCILYWT